MMTEGMELQNSTPKIRYALLDELRGFMVLCMIFYHGFLSLYDVFELDIFIWLFDFFLPIETFFACGFIFLSGLMCGFSHSNTKRGLITCLIALAVTAVTVAAAPYIGEIQIYFGILHLLGISMLFCGVFNFVLKRINKWAGFIINLLIFICLYGIPENNYNLFGIRSIIPESLRPVPWLFPFGITGESFFSADYFPVVPWLFLFVAGYFAVKTGFIQKAEKIFLPKRIKPLGFMGRHALLIYIFHQPLIYGAAYAVQFVISLF